MSKNRKKIILFLVLSILFVSVSYFCIVILSSDSFAINYFYMPFFVYPILFLLLIALILYGIQIFKERKVLSNLSATFLILAFIYCLTIYSFAFIATEKDGNKQKLEFVEETFHASKLISPSKDFVENDVIDMLFEDVSFYALGDIFVFESMHRYTSSDNTSASITVYYFENYPTIILNNLSENMKERYFFNESVTSFFVHSSDIMKGNIDNFNFSYICQTNEAMESSKRKYESYFSTIIEKDTILVAVSMHIWHNDELKPKIMVENLVENLGQI